MKAKKTNNQNSLKKSLYTCKQPLMLAYESSESAREIY